MIITLEMIVFYLNKEEESFFPKLQGRGDSYILHQLVINNDLKYFRYKFSDKTNTKLNIKRCFLDEYLELLKNIFTNDTFKFNSDSYRKYCPKTKSDGSCGYAVMIGLTKNIINFYNLNLYVIY